MLRALALNLAEHEKIVLVATCLISSSVSLVCDLNHKLERVCVDFNGTHNDLDEY